MRSRVWLLAVMAACGGGGTGQDDGGGSGGEPTGNGTVFDPDITAVSIEIDYETGQEPYTGPITGFGDSFDVSRVNLDRLFSGTKALTLPTMLGAMEDIGPVSDEQLTSEDLLALAEAHRDQRGGGETRTYYLLFVSGYFTTDAGPQTGVLGVSIGDTRVIAMFKDVIRSTESLLMPNLATYVEQTTLVHEMGHAVGLVDNGIPLTAQHKDAAHGAHCTNERCIMYWLNEAANDAAEFAKTFVTSSDDVLFDANCLADVDALTDR